MNIFFRYKLHHVFFWLVYIIFWTLFSFYYYHNTIFNAVIITSSWFIGEAGMVYLCLYLLMPRYFNRKRYGLFIVFAFAVILISSVFTAGFNVYMFGKMSPSYYIPFRTFSLYVLFDNL